MLSVLENDKIRVLVSDHGAEIQSLVWKEDDTEYIWQRDGRYWDRCAIVLFPICGRLKDGAYTYRGQQYKMDIHGFAKDTDFEIDQRSEQDICYHMTDSPATLLQYQFHFRFEVEYLLDGNSVRQTIRVLNTGNDIMIFSVGGHPGFNVPLSSRDKFEDYSIRFDDTRTPEKILMSNACLYLEKTVPFPLGNDGVLPLRHELFNEDAVFLTKMAPGVTLTGKSGKSVRLEYPGMRNLGLWHKPLTQAPYLCIEPWSSVPALERDDDDLEHKPQMERLLPGEQYENGFTMSFT